MSSELYNLIMHSNPEFWSGDNDYIWFPKERFLEYTDDHLKERFQSLDQSAINEIKKLPTLFATEEEMTDTRIGKITKIEERGNDLYIYYKFDDNYHPLSNGTLQKNRNELNIEKGEFYRGHWEIKEGNIPSFYEKYSKSLTGIAHQLKASNKKVQLIYAFNGTGKTRLSREFKDLVAPKNNPSRTEGQTELSRTKILYYNAFTEDLFYWDNDLELDAEPKMKIQPNGFTDWILGEQGKGPDIVANFQHYTTNKITPAFNPAYQRTDDNGIKINIPINSEVTFRLNPTNIVAEGGELIVTEDGNSIVAEQYEVVKISKAEESNFIWSIFYTLLDQVITILNIPDVGERETDQFNQLEYVFIDDPVSSLDENHLIELAVNLAGLIKDSKSDLKFIITTHSPLFYNVLYNELNSKNCYLLGRLDDGTFSLEKKDGDSNKSFSYHLYLKQSLEQAIAKNQVQKYHFTLLRNLYEKTANFLGYSHWSDLLKTAPGDKGAYLQRIITFSSHRTLSSEEVAGPTEPEKQTVKLLLDNLTNNYGFLQQEEQYD